MILVTGGTGLVGAHLLLHLTARGEKIRAIYRTKTAVTKALSLFKQYEKEDQFANVEWIEANILNIPSLENAFEGVDYVYHAAALVSFDPDDEERLRKTNIEGTANVVNCALAYGVKKLCHVSSIAALGDTKEGETIITEETDWNPERPHSDYALSKHGAEMEVWRSGQEGLNVVIVNPGVIFGSGFWEQGSGAMFSAIRRRQKFYTKGVCGIVAVEDVVQVMLKLMASDISGKQYTVIAENLSIKDILDAIAEGMNKKKPSVYATPFMTSLAWRVDWLLNSLLIKKRSFTKSMARSSHSHETYSNTKLLQDLNHEYTPMQPYLASLAAKFKDGQE